MWLQIIVTLFVVIILFKLFKQRQADKISMSGFLAWLLLWLIVLVVFWQPATASYLASFLGIGRGADLIIYLSIIVIFYLLFKIFVHLNKIETEITKIVREDAIKHVKKK
jgi:small membrane protein